MFFVSASFKSLARGAVLVIVVLGVTRLLRPLEGSLSEPGPAVEAARRERMEAAVQQRAGAALFGGVRALAASACWLRTNLAWERRDQAGTLRLINLTVALDERPAYFWLNGARMIASDLPEWRMTGPVPRAYRSIVVEEQARQALEFLEKGIRWHGADAALYIEMANIHWRRRGDLAAAAAFYRLAAEQPGAPYFAARLHGELLRELHRPAEALAWLRAIVVTLPSDDDSARREVVLERIRALEAELAASRGNVF